MSRNFRQGFNIRSALKRTHGKGMSQRVKRTLQITFGSKRILAAQKRTVPIPKHAARSITHNKKAARNPYRNRTAICSQELFQLKADKNRIM